MDGASVIR
jgi:hypothetical protein